MPDEKPDKKSTYGVASPPDGLPGAPGPAVSPTGMSRDDLGRIRGPSEYQENTDQFKFGASEIGPAPEYPAKPADPHGVQEPLPSEKKRDLPQYRKEG